MIRAMTENSALTEILRRAAILVAGGWLAYASGSAPRPGDQLRWALDFVVRLEQTGASRPIEVQLTGDWVSTISAIRAGEYDAQLELAHAKISGEGTPSPDSAALGQLERRLSRGFWATYRNDGTLLSAHFFNDTPASDRNLLLVIATELQFAGLEAGKWTWTAMERDAAGEYLALYSRTANGWVTKRKVKYVNLDGVSGAQRGALRIDVEESEHRFDLTPEGRIAAVEGGCRLRMGAAGAARLTSVTRIRLTALRSGRDPDRIDSLARAGKQVRQAAIVTSAMDPERLRDRKDHALIDALTTESLLEKVRSTPEDPQLLGRLTALFRVRPEAIGRALDVLRKGGPQRQVTDALALAGSTEAVETLGRLARDTSAAPVLRIDALSAFQLIRDPRADAMRLPAAVMDDADGGVASAAKLVSGSMARAGRVAHPEVSDAIDEALAAAYAKSRDEEERCRLLAAIGNSAGPKLMPAVEDALSNGSDAVRAAAVRALRLVEGPDAERRIAMTIASDGAPAVRAAAIFAASFRRPLGSIVAETLVAAAKTDPIEYVRTDAISLLRHNSDASPHTIVALKWIAEHDSKEGVRRLAGDVLASITSRK